MINNQTQSGDQGYGPERGSERRFWKHADRTKGKERCVYANASTDKGPVNRLRVRLVDEPKISCDRCETDKGNRKHQDLL